MPNQLLYGLTGMKHLKTLPAVYSKKIEQLRLAQEKAATAEAYQANLQRYRQELLFAVAAKYPLPQAAIAYLTQLEQQLNLKSFDILALQKTILRTRRSQIPTPFRNLTGQA